MKLLISFLLLTFIATASTAKEEKSKRPATKASVKATQWDSNVWEQSSEFKFWRAKPNPKPRLSKAAQQAKPGKHSATKCTSACCAKK